MLFYNVKDCTNNYVSSKTIEFRLFLIFLIFFLILEKRDILIMGVSFRSYIYYLYDFFGKC